MLYSAAKFRRNKGLKIKDHQGSQFMHFVGVVTCQTYQPMTPTHEHPHDARNEAQLTQKERIQVDQVMPSTKLLSSPSILDNWPNSSNPILVEWGVHRFWDWENNTHTHVAYMGVGPILYSK